MRRPGDTIELATLEESLPGLSAKVRFVEAPLLDIAQRNSGAHRRGRPFRYFLSEKVYEYIESHGLYRR